MRLMDNNMIRTTDAIKVIKMTSPISLSSVKPCPPNVVTQSLSLPIGANLIDLGKKLLDASRIGDTEEVKGLMQSGAPFTTDWLGTSPLHFAAQYGHTLTAEVLLRAGISRDARTKVDRTPLHIASQEGHLGIVSTLIEHGADVDAKDMLKMTPLHWSVERGHTDVVECLLSNGADVNIVSKFEKTPLDVAVDNGRLELVPLLQKYVGVTRTKPDIKPTIPSVKMRPTVLPNKNRASKSPKNHQMKPILHQNLSNWQKAFNSEHFKKIFAGFGDFNLTPEDLSSSSTHPVLALAALANVASSTSPSSLPNPADVLQWLENHGNWSNNTHTDSNVVQSAIEKGQTISLTEAGKLALNWGKETSANTSTSTNNKSNINSKVITIVDSTQLPQMINNTQSTPIVLVSGSSSTPQSQSNVTTRLTRKSPMKVTKPDGKVEHSEPKYIICNSSNTQTASHLLEIEKLKKDLAAAKKQTEEYKSKYELKEREALRYKKECEHLRAIKSNSVKKT